MTSDTNPNPQSPPPWALLVVALAVLGGAVLVALLLTDRPAAAPTAASAGAPVAPAADLNDPAAIATAHAGADVTQGNTANDELPSAHGDIDGSGVVRLSVSDAKTRYDAGSIVFVDVRSGDAFAAGHIEGAASMTSPELEIKLRSLPAGTVIVAYADQDREDASLQAAQIFAELGYGEVQALEGGLQAWQAQGYPVASGPAEGATDG